MFSLTLGGVIMELSPVSVSLSSLSSHTGHHRVTFTCSYIASQRLDIEFSSSSSSSSSSVVVSSLQSIPLSPHSLLSLSLLRCSSLIGVPPSLSSSPLTLVSSAPSSS